MRQQLVTIVFTIGLLQIISSGCGDCEVYKTRVEAKGEFFNLSNPTARTMVEFDDVSIVKPEFADASDLPERILLFCFGIVGSGDNVRKIGVAVDPTLADSVVQRGESIDLGCNESATVERGTTALRTNVMGSLRLDGREFTFESVEAQFVSRSPLEVATVLTAVDSQGNNYQFELLIGSNQIGNAPTCD